jgi:mono/diheme cytochrome c family protein
MKTNLVVLATALALAACSVARPADDATGEEIYNLLCSNCHAVDLSGNIGPALGPGSNSAGRSDLFIEFTVTYGRGKMPSFSQVLDEAQLDRLVIYIREVQGE